MTPSPSALRSGRPQQGCEHGPRLPLQGLRPVELHNLERRREGQGTAEPRPKGAGQGAPSPRPGTPVTFPLSMTRMRSQPSTVVMRWAMMSTVQPLKASRIVRWISVSVSVSMEAVASSMRMIWWGQNRWQQG